MNTIICLICNKAFKYISNTHLKTHGITQQEYKSKYPDAELKTDELKIKCGDRARGRTYEEIYGVDVAKKLKSQRSSSARSQMKSFEQIEVRRLKCGAPEYYTAERRLNMSKAAQCPDLIQRRNETILKNIENGKYSSKILGRQSNIARLYIKEYLRQYNISEDKCYYDGGGINGNEYYQVIFNSITNKKKSIAYDLVVINSGLHDIQTIIEVNGPWHYRLSDVLENPTLPACPLKTNKYTRLESYNIDALKINKALELCDNVYIFWLDSKELIQVKETIQLL